MISGNQLKNAMISGSNSIAKQKRQINELNIFPVPDGDTGTNMSLTISTVVDALEKFDEKSSAEEVSKAAASAMLRGARGNSGVILSLLFRGLSRGFEGRKEIDAESIVNALDIGVEQAYKAVMNPTEGTILTVARVAAEKGREALEHESDPVLIWDAVCMGAYEALDQTPEMLPVLKKAGVVDAGGQGLCVIFDGMMSVFKNGVIVEAALSEEEKAEETAEFFKNVAAEFDAEITFTYCTEFIVGRDPQIVTDPLELRAYLETIGDSVVVVDDDDIIKVHVHTENPGKALQKALKFGELLTVKIENMKEQHRQASEDNEAKKAADKKAKTDELKPAKPTEEYGFVTVAAGDGIKNLFMDLGCNHVVSGGQTMNPSTDDIVEAVMATPAKTVFVLPNNKNIILAAEQAVPLVTDRELIVIPTKTIPQGLTAMLTFDPDLTSGGNREEMKAAAKRVGSGTVTFAARDSDFGGHQISQGDILGLKNGKMEYVTSDPVRACSKITRSLMDKNTSFITLIYGNGMTEADAEKARQSIISKTRTDAEITLVDGGQPLYYFIISVE